MLHVIPSLSPSQGGPSVVLPLMARGLSNAGVGVDVVTTNDDGPGRRSDSPLNRPVAHEGFACVSFAKQTDFYKVSLPLSSWLRRHVSSYDVVHIHALFSFASTAAAFYAGRQNVPYIIRPLGVLNRWGTARRRPRLKALSFRFVEQPMLRDAAAIHYTSPQEQAEAEAFGVQSPAAMIPLGIDVGPFDAPPDPGPFLRQYPAAAGRPIILFLSRLDPKKGLDLLLTALPRIVVSHPRAILVIAGSGEPRFVAALRGQASSLGVADRILWTGFLDGSTKMSALAAASAYVLPSHSENFGMSLLEALAAGNACVVADGVALAADVHESGAGIVVPCEVGPLADAIGRVLGDSALRRSLGLQAKRLVTQRYSLSSMTTAILALYEAILSKPQAAH